MRSMFSIATGGPETLVLTETDTPAPQAGQVLVQVKAAGVNFPDTLIIRDLYQFKPPRPFAPGSEVAGVIEAIGPDVSGYQIGDRVMALGRMSGFATHMIVPVSGLVSMPNTMPFEEAACFIFTYGTSHYALRDRAKLCAGETLLVLGAAGGVGAAAIELGKAMGAKVIAAVSSEQKAEFCRKIGADDTVIYPRNMDHDAQKALSSAIKASVGPIGVDVVYDAVGGAYSEPAIRCLGWEGRFLVVGFPAGIPKVPLNLALLKSCQIIGVFWGAFIGRNPQAHQVYLAELCALYAAGKIRPQITASFPLAEAAKALDYIQDRKALGKIVLTLD